jgi:hypothetical protein
MAPGNQRAITAKDVLLVSLGLVSLGALYPFSDRLFDMACELAFVIGAVSVLEMARNLRWFVSDDYPIFLATSVAFVAALQLAHAAVDPHLALLGTGDANLAAQLQLASGILLGVSMCIAPWLAGRRLRFAPQQGHRAPRTLPRRRGQAPAIDAVEAHRQGDTGFAAGPGRDRSPVATLARRIRDGRWNQGLLSEVVVASAMTPARVTRPEYRGLRA